MLLSTSGDHNDPDLTGLHCGIYDTALSKEKAEHIVPGVAVQTQCLQKTSFLDAAACAEGCAPPSPAMNIEQVNQYSAPAYGSVQKVSGHELTSFPLHF